MLGRIPSSTVSTKVGQDENEVAGSIDAVEFSVGYPFDLSFVRGPRGKLRSTPVFCVSVFLTFYVTDLFLIIFLSSFSLLFLRHAVTAALRFLLMFCDLSSIPVSVYFHLHCNNLWEVFFLGSIVHSIEYMCTWLVRLPYHIKHKIS